MKTTPHNKSTRSGFTLIEMIGVLAIIAVLASLLIPRIFSAINESRISGAAMSYNSVKSGAMTYFGKFGRFGNAAGAAYTSVELTNGTPVSDYDAVLLQSGVLEKPFSTKVGDTQDIVLVAAEASTAAPNTTPAAFDLDGESAANDATGRGVIYAVLTGVSADDAKDLNDRIDGADAPLGAALGAADAAGRVKFVTPDASGTTTVYLYIAHK